MKKIIALLLVINIGSSYGVGYYDSYNQQVAQIAKAGSVAEAKAANIDISKVNPAYAASVKQLKEAVPVIIKSVKVLLPIAKDLGTSAVSGDISGLIKTGITVATKTDARDAAVNLTKTIINTIKTANTLANADPSTKNTIRDLLTAVSEDPDVSKILSYSDKIPVVGKDLHNALLNLIQLKF